MPIRMKLGDYLESHGILQREFADRIGCGQPSIARFVNGRVPSPELMKAIADATDGAVTPNDFFDIAAPAADTPVAA